MPVLTIRGQMGSGAPEIGKLIAEQLHIDYIDREIIAMVARRLKWTERGIVNKETPPGSLIGRIAEALGRGQVMGPGYAGAYLPMYEIPLDDAHYLAGLESVIKELANTQAVVIRGRGSQFILKEFPSFLHVLLIAPEHIRIKRIISSLNLSESDARKEIARSDSSHREFIKRFFQADLENPINYDIVINTANLTFEDAAVIMIKALRAKQKAVKGSARARRKKPEQTA
jgi:cytidylate kinase